MQKIILFFAFAFVLIYTSCGPAAENRELMYARSKIFQDSIANVIHTQMNEAEDQSHQAALTGAPQPTAQQDAGRGKL